MTRAGCACSAKPRKRKPRGKKPPSSPYVSRVFLWSSPATADGVPVARWRVSRPDVLREIALELSGERDIYVEGAGDHGLWLGLRDNRDAGRHAKRLRSVGDELRLAGFRVVDARYNGRLVGLYVRDRDASLVQRDARGRFKRARNR